MNDALNTKNEHCVDDLDSYDIEDTPIDEKDCPISIDARRRLEEKLAERQLAREMREFDFDF